MHLAQNGEGLLLIGDVFDLEDPFHPLAAVDVAHKSIAGVRRNDPQATLKQKKMRKEIDKQKW